MCSLGVLSIAVVITSSVFLVIRGDITGLDLPPNICLCVNIRNCNVRDSGRLVIHHILRLVNISH